MEVVMPSWMASVFPGKKSRRQQEGEGIGKDG